MRGPNRRRKPARREPFRDPRPIILIVCEGAVTEPQYFKSFAVHHKNSRIRVRLADATGVPFSLVKAAKRYKLDSENDARRERDENLAYDSVWCVFDVDEHPHLNDARQMAVANGINLAISNPCFELWLILHLRESPGMKDRHQMRAILKNHINNYDKHVDFHQYAAGYPKAVTRAEKLAESASRGGSPGCNPTTNVHELTELILKGREPDPA